LSRIETEEAEGECEDVGACVRNAAQRAAESAEARSRDIKITATAAAFPAPVRAAIDPARLGIALGALLDNAVSFSPNGGEVELRLERVDAEDGSRIALSVLDRGPGLPEGDAGRVFDRFFSTRSGAATASARDPLAHRTDAHCGLGLAIVQGIARRSGGSVEAYNREGGGARFTLYLRVPR
jgi:signal transduction histidine kinase